MTAKNEQNVVPANEEFVLNREFAAPRDVVFRAWTEPDQLAKWWGPKGFTMLTCTVDLRPGGHFHYGMRSPDGSDMWGKFVYREIVAPERLVYIVSFSDKDGRTTRHPMAPKWPLEMLNHVTFTARGNRTLVTLRSSAYNASETERKTFIDGFKSMEMGFGGTMDQLDALLAATNNGNSRGNITRDEVHGREYVLRRLFDAPRDLVYAMWTDPRHLSRWWGPHTMTVPVAEMDVRPGGQYRIVMRGPDGEEYPMRGVYKVVVRPERISFTCNLDEHPSDWFGMLDKLLEGAPRATTFEMLITVTFSERNGKTEVEIHNQFESEAVRAAMVKMGMREGWSESFDRLDSELTNAKR